MLSVDVCARCSHSIDAPKSEHARELIDWWYCDVKRNFWGEPEWTHKNMIAPDWCPHRLEHAIAESVDVES